MNLVVRTFVALAVASGVGAVSLVYFQAKSANAATLTPQQRLTQMDERLLQQLVTPDMASAEAEAIPTYSDFARELRDGVVKVIRSQEALRQRLDADWDLLERYPPDGVPGRHLRAYLEQNSSWKRATDRSMNEQIRAIKDLRGDLGAFFLTHPEEYDRIGKRFEAAVTQAIERRRPAARILQEFASRRAALAAAPTPLKKAQFSRAEAAYRRWRQEQR